jgi:prepilin-type N-terminal cleavage/methylation domain-containing protein
MGISGGYTLIEMIVVVAIIGILAGIVSATYQTLQARIRFSQMKANMDTIAMAGYTDFSSNLLWAPMPIAGTLPPSFAASYSLSVWPNAPCPGWSYGWDNWTDDFAGLDVANVVRVTLRDTTGTAVWSYCVDTVGGSGNCMFQDPLSSATPIDITSATNKYIYCNE